MRSTRLLVPDSGWRAERDLAYGDEQRQRLDIYLPPSVPLAAAPDDRQTGSVATPVVVFFYGGGWRSGRRQDYRFIGEALTSRGYVVVIPDYRVYPDVRFPTFVEDGARAMSWVRSNISRYGGDPDRTFVMGHSAGAHLAALLVTDRSYLEAVGLDRRSVRGFIGLAGPYAFDPLLYASTRPMFGHLDDPAPAQPVSFVDGGEPPMLLMHGADDDVVYPINSEVLADRVASAGGSAEEIEYPDMGHIRIVLALTPLFRQPGGPLDRTSAFIDRLSAAGSADRPGSTQQAAIGP